MPTLSVFNSVTLDGYFTGPGGDLSWAHAAGEDKEYDAFVSENAGTGGVLVFGRITYQMMASYWPTPAAAQNDPKVAEGMNRMKKIVFSRTLKEASWSNTTLFKGDLETEIRRLKSGPGESLVILGSGSLVAQLARAHLIDEYQLVVTPVVLGKGRTMFEGLDAMQPMKLVRSRVFGNGKTFLSYQPLIERG